MNWWARLLRPTRVEAQLDAELHDHFERLVASHVSAGLPEPEARRRATLEFGGLDQVKELCRDARGTRVVEDVVQDLRHACRAFARSPGFAGVAVLTLALGIGANMAIFTLIEALILRPLPVHHPQELIALTRVQGAQSGGSFSYPQVRHLAEQSHIFSALCGFGNDALNVGPPTELEVTSGAWVTGGYFQTLGVAPAAGRLLGPDDDRPGATPAAVITDSYWARKFGRDPAVIGRTLQVEGAAVPIVGVTPPAFFGAIVGDVADVTLAVNVRPQLQPDRAFFLGAGARWMQMLARPRVGLSRDEVKAQANVIWAQWLHANTSPALAADARQRALSITLDVLPGESGSSGLRERFRRPLVAAMALVVLVLLIACVNVANLMLARATARQRETALRMAIGAGRGRIVRQLLTESALLALAAAAVAIAFGWFGSRGLVELIGAGPLGPDSAGGIRLDLSPNWRMLTFTVAIAALTTVLFGVVPALRAAMIAPTLAATIGSDRIVDPRRRVAFALVTAQVALSLLLLIGAGLFVRTLHNLRTLDRGFRHDDVLVVEIDASRAGYKDAALRVFNREALAFAERLPGVIVAAAASVTPLRGGGISQSIAVNGQRIDGEVHFNNVGARYFEALQTRVVSGREFTHHDDADTQPVAIVNQAFARQHMSGNPLGQRLLVGGSTREMQVVGVVEDAVYETLRDSPPPTVYAPYFQRGARGNMALVLYAPGSLAQVSSAIRAEVQPKLAGKAIQIGTLTAQFERSLTRERLMATVATVLGTLALVLAAVGLYGLLAYWVQRRTPEIGVRLALGAQRSQVMRLVIRDAVGMLALGIVAGIPAAWALLRFLSSLLFGLTATDLPTIAAATAVLTLAGLLAAALPARRASRVDPILALRYE